MFGFLGANGAGKTTVFKMLAGLYAPTSGQIKVAGMNIVERLVDVRQQIGYCPQAMALVDLLTPKEHLTLYAKLRGLPSADIPRIVQEKLTEMDLLSHGQKRAG